MNQLKKSKEVDPAYHNEFSLKIINAYYVQDSKVPMHMNTLTFSKDGFLFMKGFDEVGEYEYTGELKDEYAFFIKNYIGKHKIIYLGKMNGNSFDLVYDFYENWIYLKEKINIELNAKITFDLTIYYLIKDEIKYEMSLCHHKGIFYKGICLYDGILCRVKAKLNEKESYFKAELEAKNYFNKLKGYFDHFNKICLITNNE